MTPDRSKPATISPAALDAKLAQLRPMAPEPRFAPPTARRHPAALAALSSIAQGYRSARSTILWDADDLGFRTCCGDKVRAIALPEPTVVQPRPEHARWIIEVYDVSPGAAEEFMGFL